MKIKKLKHHAHVLCTHNRETKNRPEHLPSTPCGIVFSLVDNAASLHYSTYARNALFVHSCISLYTRGAQPKFLVMMYRECGGCGAFEVGISWH